MNPIKADKLYIQLEMLEEFLIWSAVKTGRDLLELAKKRRPFLRDTTLAAVKLAADLLDAELSSPMEIIEQAPF